MCFSEIFSIVSIVLSNEIILSKMCKRTPIKKIVNRKTNFKYLAVDFSKSVNYV